MICEHCGMEHAEEGYDESETIEAVWSCRNAISAQLASMTKRAEEAERTIRDYQEGLKRTYAREQAAMAKLATAVQLVGDLDRLLWIYKTNTMRRTPERLLDRIAKNRDTLRAVGIDPSKEQGKIDPRPLCIACGRRWCPVEGVDATVERCGVCIGTVKSVCPKCDRAWLYQSSECEDCGYVGEPVAARKETP